TRPADISIEGFKPLHLDDGGDATNVESLPLGERIHQEAVAKELFTSGEQSGASAIDLARWASEELSRKEKQRSQITSELERLPAKAAAQPAAEAPAPAAAPAAAPQAAEAAEPHPSETTGEVIARARAQSTRRTL